jgi:E3 ubiquitin-protein ligase MARCH6
MSLIFLQIATNGWTHPDPIPATTEVIGPVTGGLLGMIILPAAAFRALDYIVPLPVDDKFLCRCLIKFSISYF